MRRPHRPPGFFVNDILTRRLRPRQSKTFGGRAERSAHESVKAADQARRGHTRLIRIDPTTRTSKLRGAPNRG